VYATVQETVQTTARFAESRIVLMECRFFVVAELLGVFLRFPQYLHQHFFRGVIIRFPLPKIRAACVDAETCYLSRFRINIFAVKMNSWRSKKMQAFCAFLRIHKDNVESLLGPNFFQRLLELINRLTVGVASFGMKKLDLHSLKDMA